MISTISLPHPPVPSAPPPCTRLPPCGPCAARRPVCVCSGISLRRTDDRVCSFTITRFFGLAARLVRRASQRRPEEEPEGDRRAYPRGEGVSVHLPGRSAAQGRGLRRGDAGGRRGHAPGCGQQRSEGCPRPRQAQVRGRGAIAEIGPELDGAAEGKGR